MEPTLYNVIFSGEIDVMSHVEIVKNDMIKNFNMSKEKVERLFAGEKIIVKSNVSYQVAVKYRDAFRGVGAICSIEPCDESVGFEVDDNHGGSEFSSNHPGEIFNVVFSGEIFQGFVLKDVRVVLKEILKADDRQVDQLFCGQPVIIKRKVDRYAAEKIDAVFRKAGAICRIDAVMPAAAMPDSQQCPPATLDENIQMSSQSVPESPSQGNLSCCPKCGYQLTSQQALFVTSQGGLGECPACGIIMEKYGKNDPNALVEQSGFATDSSLSRGKKETGIIVEATFYPLSLDLYFFKPIIEIDGVVFRGLWWKQIFFPTSSGSHTVRIYHRYLFRPECGANSIDLTINDGDIWNVKYFKWPLMYAKGLISGRMWREYRNLDQLEYASFWKRCLAGMIDLIIAVASVGIVAFMICNVKITGIRENTIVLIAIFSFYALIFLYFAYFESSIWQATPGKKMLNMRLMRVDGSKVTFLRALARSLCKLFLSYFGVMALFTRKKQGLHDLIAKTVVVREE